MNGTFDPLFDLRSWFDPTLSVAGLFDTDLVDDSGPVTITASGALVAQAASMSGAAVSGSTATGALSAQAATVDGTAASGSTASGALAAQAAEVDGTAVSGSTASGALAAQAAEVDGTAVSESQATGALVAQSASVAGTAASESVATGALEAQAATLAGTASASDAPIVTGGAHYAGGILDLIAEGDRQRSRALSEIREEEREARRIIERIVDEASDLAESQRIDKEEALIRELEAANLKYRVWYAAILADELERERLRREDDAADVEMMLLM